MPVKTRSQFKREVVPVDTELELNIAISEEIEKKKKTESDEKQVDAFVSDCLEQERQNEEELQRQVDEYYQQFEKNIEVETVKETNNKCTIM
jgi:hypothetical protein